VSFSVEKNTPFETVSVPVGIWNLEFVFWNKKAASRVKFRLAAFVLYYQQTEVKLTLWFGKVFLPPPICYLY